MDNVDSLWQIRIIGHERHIVARAIGIMRKGSRRMTAGMSDPMQADLCVETPWEDSCVQENEMVRRPSADCVPTQGIATAPGDVEYLRGELTHGCGPTNPRIGRSLLDPVRVHPHPRHLTH